MSRRHRRLAAVLAPCLPGLCGRTRTRTAVSARHHRNRLKEGLILKSRAGSKGADEWMNKGRIAREKLGRLPTGWAPSSRSPTALGILLRLLSSALLPMHWCTLFTHLLTDIMVFFLSHHALTHPRPGKKKRGTRKQESAPPCGDDCRITAADAGSPPSRSLPLAQR